MSYMYYNVKLNYLINKSFGLCEHWLVDYQLDLWSQLSLYWSIESVDRYSNGRIDRYTFCTVDRLFKCDIDRRALVKLYAQVEWMLTKLTRSALALLIARNKVQLKCFQDEN